MYRMTGKFDRTGHPVPDHFSEIRRQVIFSEDLTPDNLPERRQSSPVRGAGRAERTSGRRRAGEGFAIRPGSPGPSARDLEGAHDDEPRPPGKGRGSSQGDGEPVSGTQGSAGREPWPEPETARKPRRALAEPSGSPSRAHSGGQSPARSPFDPHERGKR